MIGPAKIISELKQHPDMIEMHFNKNSDNKPNKTQAKRI
jgi:hypothetical protein